MTLRRYLSCFPRLPTLRFVSAGRGGRRIDAEWAWLPKVHVDVDNYGVPHIYAESWTDAARVLGYLHASERLWQMDMLRRQASGTSAEILGEQGLESDILMRQLGMRRTCEALWAGGDLPAAFRAELEAYAAGVNARIAELGEKDLPPMFAALGYQAGPLDAGRQPGVFQIHGLGPVGHERRSVVWHDGRKTGRCGGRRAVAAGTPLRSSPPSQSNRLGPNGAGARDVAAAARRRAAYAAAHRNARRARDGWGAGPASAATTGPSTAPRPPRASRSCATIRTSDSRCRRSGTRPRLGSAARTSPA